MGKPFDINLKLLPPRLQMQLWVLGLDANTSKVGIAYRSGCFTSNLSYAYGSHLEASMSTCMDGAVVKATAKSNADLNLDVVYRGFRFGVRGNPQRGSVGAGLSYGAALLPFPQEMSDVFNAAGIGLQSMAADIRTAPDNPLAWFKMHSDDQATIKRAVDLGQKIADQGNANSLGAGLRLDYTPERGLVIYGGLLLRF